MFEAYTYELLLDDVLKSAPEEIDTRPGSIFYDAVSGILIKVAKLYTDLDLVFELTQIDTATGEYLDIKASSEYGIERHAAIKAKYYASFEGITPDLGTRFFTDGLYFVLRQAVDGTYCFEAEIPGIGGNNVYEGTAAVPVNRVAGLIAATFGKIMEYGADAESDDSLRKRVQEKIAGPAENGNKQHYKTWCESIEGVGRARIYPLWNGPNTVKAVLINSLGKPCSDEVVDAVQQYIDPNTEGNTVEIEGKTYIIGDGQGEGVANLGAHFTAVAANAIIINVSLDVELSCGATKDSAVLEARKAIEKYLQELVLETEEINDIVVRVSSVGAILAGLSSILDYKNLTINGGTENVEPGEDYVPICGEVSLGVI